MGRVSEVTIRTAGTMVVVADSKIEQVPAALLSNEILEAWRLVTAEPELFGVTAERWRPVGNTQDATALLNAEPSLPLWTVIVPVMQSVHGLPMEAVLRETIPVALASVTAVIKVHEEDREAWVVSGTPVGMDLIAAVDGVLDRLEDPLRDACRNA
jgi:hypothetical protein